MRKHGPWTINDSREVYRDPWITVVRDEVTRPDGHPGTYATVLLKAGVCIVAQDRAQSGELQVHLTREFHYAVGRTTIEGVSGGIEKDETAATTAVRELAEELGLIAGRWTHLGKIDPFTAAVRSTVDLYLAEQLTGCPAAPEGTELIERVTMPLGQAMDMVVNGVITHGPTCITLLRIAHWQTTHEKT